MMDEITATVLSETNLKNRYVLLNKFVANLSREEAVDIVKLPQNQLNNAIGLYLRIKCIEKFRIYDAIVVALLENDEQIVGSIVKWDFLFQHPSPLAEWNFFCAQLIPRISYSLRLKLLNNLTKYSRDQLQLRDFFIGILNGFNLHQALPVLLSCHSDLVKSVIRERRINLTPKQLQTLAKKDVQLAFWYLEEIETNPNLYNVKIDNLIPCVTFMCQIGSPELCISYLQHTRRNFENLPLGIRATKKILKNNQETIITNAEKFKNCLRKDTLCSKLRQNDLESFLIALSPRKYYEFEPNQFFEMISLKRREDVLVNIFKKKYQKNIDSIKEISEMPDDLIGNLVEMIPNETKYSWARAQLQLNPDSNKLIKLLPPPEAVSALKNLIETSKCNTEITPSFAEIVRNANPEVQLSETTWLFEKFSYDENVFYSFFETIFLQSNEKKLPLTLAIIFEKNLIANPDKFIPFNNSHDCDIFLWACRKTSEVFIENNREIKNIVIIFLKYFTKNSWNFYSWDEYFNKHKYPKSIILEIITHLQDSYPENSQFWDEKSNWVNKLFLRTAFKHFLFSQEISNEKREWLIEKLCQYLDQVTEEHTVDSFLNLLYKLKSENEKLKKLQLKFVAEQVYPKALVKNLRKHPEILLRNFSALNQWILRQPAKKKFLFNFLLKKYSRVTVIGIDQDLLKECETILSDLEKNKSWSLVLRILYSRTKHDFGDVVRFYPTKQKVAPDDNVEVHETQETIAKYLGQFLLEPHEKQEVFLRFLDSDFLHEILGSLYRYCTHSPLDSTVDFLEGLSDNKVSIQKHIITLTTLISTAANCLKLFSNWHNFSHVSIRFVLFTRMLKSACFDQELSVFGLGRTNSKTSMEILLEALDSLTKNDVDTWTFFIEKSQMLPTDNFAKFYQKLYENFESTNFENVDFINRSKLAMLKVLNPTFISALPEKFLLNLLTKTGLFNPKTTLEIQTVLISITTSVLFVYPGKNIEFFSEKFNNEIVEKIQFSIDNEKSIKQICTSFIDSVTSFEISTDNQREVLQEIYNKFRPLLLSIYSFDLIVQLELYVIKIDFQNQPQTLDKLRQRIDQLLTRLESEFDHETVTLFAIDPIVSFLKNQIQDLEDVIKFSNNFIQEKSTFHIQMIITKLLPKKVDEKLDFFTSYEHLIETLTSSEFEAIKFLLTQVIYASENRDRRDARNARNTKKISDDNFDFLFFD